MIGDEVEIRVIDIRGDKVRIGVVAPRNVSVHRREVYDSIKEENLKAAQVMPGDVPGLASPASDAKPQAGQLTPLAASQAAPLKIAVLVSGGGTTLANLVEQIQTGKLNATLPVVIASRPGIKGIEIAKKAGIPVFIIPRKDFDSVQKFSDAIFHIVNEHAIDLICLGGWLQLLDIPGTWAGRIMNIHPALLPSFGGKGMYGHHVHEAVLKHGCKISGCTVHMVDNVYDNGPIVVQKSCAVLASDTPDTLAARVFELEKLAYPEAIRQYAAELKKRNP